MCILLEGPAPKESLVLSPNITFSDLCKAVHAIAAAMDIIVQCPTPPVLVAQPIRRINLSRLAILLCVI